MSKGLNITFKYAKWQYEYWKANFETTKSQYDYGKMQEWKTFMQCLCEHNWVDVKITQSIHGDDIHEKQCSECGIWQFEDCQMYVGQSCDNCRNLETEGGDSVPYGSTNVSLPEYSYCTCEATEDMSDEAYKLWEEMHMQHNENCPYWEGKIYKSR